MQYVIARSAAEALDALLKGEGKAKIVAGGSDVMVDYNAGKIAPEILVDISRTEELRGIRIGNSVIEFGAAVTLTEIATHPEIRKMYPSLCKGCGTVGSLQIRNSATLVGNVVSAQPAGDGAVSLSVLAPVFTILSKDGIREVPMTEMYAGFGRSKVDSTSELVTKITVPIPAADEAAAFQRLELRKSLSLPMLNTAAMVKVTDGRIAWARITMAPVGVGPVHAEKAEEYLRGKEMTDEVLAEAGRLALENANPRSNPLRGSREYRIQTLPVMVRRALEDCRAQLQ